MLFVFGTDLLQTVNPGGVDTQPIVELNSSGGLKWSRGEELLKIAPEDLRISPNGKTFEIQWRNRPKSTTSLNLLQIDDGRWSYSLDGVRFAPTEKNSMGTVSIPLKEDVNVVGIQRKPSAWIWLQALGVALLGVCCIPWKAFARGSLIRDEHAGNAAGMDALGNSF